MTTVAPAMAGVAHDDVYVAVVHATDGIRFAVSSDSAAVLTHRLAEYVRERAADVLWPDDAAHLQALLARGDLSGAVDCYFWHVGDRWDREWLIWHPDTGRSTSGTR